MSDRKLKYWLNELMNRIAADSAETDDQVVLMREAATLLSVEAAALEVATAARRSG